MSSVKRNAAALAVLAVLAVARTAMAREIDVNPESAGAAGEIESARAGDIVRLGPGTYRFHVRLVNQGTAEQPIIIEARDRAAAAAGSPPVWDLSGKRLEDWPGSAGGTHFGCWTIDGGGYYIIRDVVFRGCRSSRHPVGGIVLRHAHDVTMSRLLFEDNDQGIQGDGENVLLELSELRRNGDTTSTTGTNKTHNIYMTGGGSFVLRSSFIHDSADGVNLKIDVRDGLVEGNTIARGKAGSLSMETANGLCSATQHLVFRGNAVIASRDEARQEIAIRNVGAAANLRMDLEVMWNTFYFPPSVFASSSSQSSDGRPIVRIDNDTMKSVRLVLANNVVASTPTVDARAAPPLFLLADSSDKNHTVVEARNIIDVRNDVGFVDPSRDDLHMRADSSIRGLADLRSGFEAPSSQPFVDTSGASFAPRATSRDPGAFESATSPPSPLRDGLPPAKRFVPPAPRTCSSCSLSAAAAGDPPPFAPSALAGLLFAGTLIRGRRTRRPCHSAQT